MREKIYIKWERTFSWIVSNINISFRKFAKQKNKEVIYYLKEDGKHIEKYESWKYFQADMSCSP